MEKRFSCWIISSRQGHRRLGLVAGIPKSSRETLSSGQDTRRYKKKSVMVSDTRGNKSFLPVRMRKTSPLLSLPLSFSPLRTSFALRLSIRVIHVLGWRVSTFVSSKNIETTQYRLTLHDQTCASILVGNEAPRLRLFVPRSSS